MMINFTFEIDDKIKDKFEECAQSEYRSMAAQLRLLVEEYIESKHNRI